MIASMHSGSTSTAAPPAVRAAREPEAPSEPLELRVAQRLLILLALTLPFEVPLFRLGPLQITTVELALYAMLTAWGVATTSALVRRPLELPPIVGVLRAQPLVQAALLWCVVLFA